MRKYGIFSAIFAILLTTNTFAAESDNLIFSTCDGNYSGLCALTSNKQMTTWRYTDNIVNLPDDIHEFLYIESACTEGACLGVGGYITPKDKEGIDKIKAFIFHDNRDGSQFQYQEIIPPNTNEALLRNITCANNECIAIGSKWMLNFKEQPLILRSTGDMSSWQEINPIPGIDDKISIEVMRSACTNDYCVIAGSLYNLKTDAYSPIFLVSHHGKINWSIAAITHKTAFNKRLAFKKSACSGNACAAVGSTYDTTTQSFYPLIYVSRDAGNSWTEQKVNEAGVILTDVTCDKGSCIAVGYYNLPITGMHNKEIILVNHGDDQWQIKNLVSAPNTHRYVESVNCSGQFCLLGGVLSTNTGTTQPVKQYTNLLYISHDHGDSWQPIDVGLHTDPAHFPTVYFSCTASNCLLATTDMIKDPKHPHAPARVLPVVAMSDRTGEHWTRHITKNIPDNITNMRPQSVYHGQ